jgi:hypothetical protein
MQDEQVISTTDVRQGSKRKDNLRVLLMSTALLAVVSVVLYFGYISL